MTLSLAQKILGTYDLGGPGLPVYQLVVNWLPCAMCFGATCWSGVRSLVIAGSGSELEEITGFYINICIMHTRIEANKSTLLSQV